MRQPTNVDISKVTWQIGPDTEVRNQFVKKSVLKNTKDTSYRAVQENW
jgi:hypothetical protein